MTINIYVQPGETISQALSRAGLERLPPITLPPGVHIHGDPVKRARLMVHLGNDVDRRKTGIPFMPRGEP